MFATHIINEELVSRHTHNCYKSVRILKIANKKIEKLKEVKVQMVNI